MRREKGEDKTIKTVVHNVRLGEKAQASLCIFSFTVCKDNYDHSEFSPLEPLSLLFFLRSCSEFEIGDFRVVHGVVLAVLLVPAACQYVLWLMKLSNARVGLLSSSRIALHKDKLDGVDFLIFLVKASEAVSKCFLAVFFILCCNKAAILFLFGCLNNF